MSDSENPRPTDRSDDDTFARLRDADPAADADIDLDAVRREVDRRIDDTPPVALPTRRGPRWLQVAAVAAAVTLVGSGAFVVGRQTGAPGEPLAGPSTTVLTAAPETMPVGDLPAGSPPAGNVPAGPAVGPRLSGGVAESTTSEDRAFAGWGGGRLHFNDGGLSGEAGTAEAFGYDASEVVNAATAERIAAAVGVAGTASVQYQAWTVGPVDGSGPSVSLMGDGMGSVSYWDPAASPPCYEGSGVSDSSAAASAEPAPPCLPAADAIGVDDAIARSTDLMARIGLDPANYTFSSPDEYAAGGSRTVLAVVTVGQVGAVDPANSGPQWSFTFTGDRLAGFYGGLAPIVSLGQYTVISPADAVARMNDPRFGVTAGPIPIDTRMPDGAEPMPMPEPDNGVVTVPPAPVPGDRIAWPVTEITVTGATLGLTSQYQTDGSVLLIPAWTMTGDDGGIWTVVAVTDDELDFSS